jgi:hypothetical protein
MLLSNPANRILAYPNFDKLQRYGELFFCPPELEQELSDFLVKEKIYPCISDADIFLQYDILCKKYANLIFSEMHTDEKGQSLMMLYNKKVCPTYQNAHSEYFKIDKFCAWALSLIIEKPKDLVDVAKKYTRLKG